MEEVFHLETGRVIGNDWVVWHDNRYFQVKAQARQYAPAKSKVTVCEWEDGRIEILYKGKARPQREIEAPQAKPPAAIRLVNKPPRPSGWKPPANHPWRRGAAEAAMRRATASTAP